MNRTRLLAIFAPIALFLTACGVNSIPTAEENAKAKWADVQNQYQRRADLIPNLVATVRARRRAGAQRAARGHRGAGERDPDHGHRPTSSPIPAAMQPLRRGAAAARRSRCSGCRRPIRSCAPTRISATCSRRSKAPRTASPSPGATITRRSRPIIPRSAPSPSVIGARVIYGSQPMAPFQADEAAQRAPTVDFGNSQ